MLEKLNSKRALKVCLSVLCVLILIIGIYIYANRGETEKPVHYKAWNSNFDWNVNPESASDMENEATYIVEVKYTGNEKSFKEAGASIIKTEYTVDVINVLKGDLDEKEINIVGYGGTISLDEYIENSTSEELGELSAELDILKMSKKTLRASTFEFTDDFGVNLKKNDTAIVFLNEKELSSNQYPIMCAGLGLLEKETTQKYTNVESKLTIDNSLVKKIILDNEKSRSIK